MQRAILDGLRLRRLEEGWGSSAETFAEKAFNACGKLADEREKLEASQARKRYLDKELLETKEALEDEQRKHGDLVIECAELQATIARQKDQLAKARAQVEADESERVRELELEMSGLLACLKGVEHRLAEHKLIEVTLQAVADGETPLERLGNLREERRDLERSLEGARADAKTKTQLLDVVARERDEARDEVRELKQRPFPPSARRLEEAEQQRDTMSKAHDLMCAHKDRLAREVNDLKAALDEARRTEQGLRMNLAFAKPDAPGTDAMLLLADLFAIVDRHAPALHGAGCADVYEIVWRGRRVLGREG